MDDAVTIFVWFLIIVAPIIIAVVVYLKNADKSQPTPPTTKSAASPPKKSQNKRANTALETVEGYSIRYMYEDVNVCVWDYKIPAGTKPDNKIVFIQERENKNDPNAVMLLLVPQKKKLGYLYRGKMQEMVNDYLDRGDMVTARICNIRESTYVDIDMVFYVKNK